MGGYYFASFPHYDLLHSLLRKIQLLWFTMPLWFTKNEKNSTTVYYIHIGLYGHPFTGKRFIADLVVSKLNPFRNSWPPPTLRDVSARMVKSKLEVAASREPVFSRDWFKGKRHIWWENRWFPVKIFPTKPYKKNRLKPIHWVLGVRNQWDEWHVAGWKCLRKQ